MEFKYQIFDWDSFNKTITNFNKFVSKNKIRINQLEDGIAQITTTEAKFDEWHLAELGKSYGWNYFRNKYALQIVDNQSCNIPINEEKPITIIQNKWKNEIKFNSKYLNLAESSQMNRLANALTDDSIIRLNNQIKSLKIEKDLHGTSPGFKYQIIKSILIIIDTKVKTIISLLKIEWIEK